MNEVTENNVLLIFPPQWRPMSFYLSVPLLLGQLKSAGIKAIGWDANIDFYRYLLNKQYLQDVFDKFKKISTLSNKNEREVKISEFLKANESNIIYAINNIDVALNVLKTEKFYIPKMLHKALTVIRFALKFVSLEYFPTEFSFEMYKRDDLKLCYHEIKKACFDKDTNIYCQFFENEIDNKLTDKIKLVGISISSFNQLIAGLTIANIIKKKTKAKVCIGGSFFSKNIETIKKYSDFFDCFADFILYGDGEKSIIELYRYINKELPIEQVSNLVYKDGNNNIVSNNYIPITSMDEISNICLDGYDLKKYFAPEIIVPMQISKGCSWGKCSFCDFLHGKVYFYIKTPQKIISEMKYLKEKYNISKFEITDDTIPAVYYGKFADLLLEENLNINYYSYTRLEKNFTSEILEKLYKSGLRMTKWGIETFNNRIFELMNKGVPFQDRLKILENSSNAGIWNIGFFIFGFPSETVEEAIETQTVIFNNLDKIHQCIPHLYDLNKLSYVYLNHKKFNIKKIIKREEFEMADTYEDVNMTADLKSKVYNDFVDKYLQIKQNKTSEMLPCEGYTFLYAEKYGKDGLLSNELR